MRVFWILVCVLGWLTPASAQNAQEMAAAKKILTDLQERSIRQNREYCGLLLRRDDGSLIATRAFRGAKASCKVRRIPRDGRVVASFHTHGAYLPGFDNEVPSLLDLEVEMEWGIDGYVSTPGGRFWHVDGRRGEINMICDTGCLPRDAKFQDQSRVFGKIRSNYDLDTLIERTFRSIHNR